MIIGLGLDAIEIERFAHFNSYSSTQLRKVFSEAEITYCLKNPLKSAERFAARFAAKEAFYKALTQALGKPPCPFFKLCKLSSIVCSPAPQLIIDWQKLGIAPMQSLVTITHAKKLAIAQVILINNLTSLEKCV